MFQKVDVFVGRTSVSDRECYDLVPDFLVFSTA